MKPFDVVIIGAGQAGVPLAQKLTAAGRTVALIERSELGGSCVNFGCTPTKAVLASARVAHLARRASEYGIQIADVRVDYRAVMTRARQIVQASRSELQASVDAMEGLSVLRGHARLTGHAEGSFGLQVSGQQLQGRQVVLNTGTRSVIPAAIEGLADVPFLHAGNWLDLNDCPEHLLMIGGGAIGLELSQFYRRMGARVTLIENTRQVASPEDADVAAAVQRTLESEGIDVRLGTEVLGVHGEATHLSVVVRSSGTVERLEGSHVFVAVGRRPNTDDLGLECVGVQLDEDGFVVVDERLASSVPGVWVAGDIRGGLMFTHTSWDDHRVLASQLLGEASRTTQRVVPYGVFTDPPLGRVGMTETEARDRVGDSVRVTWYELKHNGKAQELGEPDGFVKLVLDADDQLLGAAVFGVHADEVVHAYAHLLHASLRLEVLASGLHLHPSITEAVQSAARRALER